jgi:glycosyltransferase involved in cell wall biosynthesis
MTNFPFERKYDFVYVSSFAKHKRHDQIVNVAPPGSRICFVGRDLGSLPRIQEAIEKRKGEIKVDVLQSVDDDFELFRLLRSSYCGVFPSVFEGFGIPILEYAACGLHVIASDIKPFLELSEYVDVFVAADDENSLREAMAQAIMANPITHPVEGLNKVLRGKYTEQAILEKLCLALGMESSVKQNGEASSAYKKPTNE